MYLERFEGTVTTQATFGSTSNGSEIDDGATDYWTFGNKNQLLLLAQHKEELSYYDVVLFLHTSSLTHSPAQLIGQAAIDSSRACHRLFSPSRIW